MMSRQVVESAEGRAADRGVVPVTLVEVQPVRQLLASLSL